MFLPILRVTPSFSEKWKDETGDTPYYLALSNLARHMIGLLSSGKIDEIRSIFGVVEQWLLQGDNYVREAATAGLLEDLQNGNLHQTTEPKDFLPYLPPESRFWWEKVDAFWQTGAPIRDDRATSQLGARADGDTQCPVTTPQVDRMPFGAYSKRVYE